MKKNILICGSSKNLGKFLSEKFLDEDYNVIKISRNLKPEKNKNSYKCDLMKNNHCKNTLKKINKKYKSLDGIIFSVGDSKPQKDSKLEAEKYLASLKINLITLVILIDNYMRVYKKKKTNFIVISSIAGSRIINAPAEYSVSKSALNYFCKIKAKELIKYGIKINIISPGNIFMKDNSWGKKMRKNKEKIKKYLNSNVPSKRFILPNEIYSICKVLLEENNNYVGSNVIIDGGQSL